VSEAECPVCGGAAAAPWGVRRGRKLVRCRDCGLVYVHPIPAADTHHRGVTDSRVYTDDQLAKRPFFERRAHELLERVERLRGGPGRLLDVGCGIGTELRVARERGWHATGIELAAASLAIARDDGLDVIGEPLGQVPLPPASFDLVTVNHALEHIPHVRPVLDEVRRVLRPGGLLFVSVPNLDAWQHRLRLDRLGGLAFGDDHFLFFTPAALRRLLATDGFAVLELGTHRWLDFQRRPASGYVAPFRALNALVERLGFGIEIFALARAR
jgi:SAM-dependent methyltransferase